MIHDKIWSGQSGKFPDNPNKNHSNQKPSRYGRHPPDFCKTWMYTDILESFPTGRKAFGLAGNFYLNTENCQGL